MALRPEKQMEKTIFLFQRHRDRTRDNFARHYINAHAPLGAKLTRSLLGYTVNLVENSRAPDALPNTGYRRQWIC